MQRLTRGVIVVGILATACARSVIPGPSVGPPTPAIDQARIAIYEATLRHLAGSGFGGDWKTVFINARICRGAGSATERRDCKDRFNPEEQDELLERLSDLKGEVRFVAPEELDRVIESIFEGESGDVLLHVGPIETRGGGVDVAGSHYCGGLCAGGAVWMLEESTDGWTVTGPNPKYGVWIS
jgi:hypothetical protein